MSAYDCLAAHYALMYEGNYETLQHEDIVWLDTLFQQRGVKDVLDCSCGDGIHAVPLAQQGYHLTGSDVSRNMIRQAKRKSASAGVHFPLHVLDFRRLNHTFPERTFDVVLALGHSLSHLLQRDDVVRTLRQMNDVLRPGGILIVDLPDLNQLRSATPLSDGIIQRDRDKTVIFFSHRRCASCLVILDLYRLSSRGKRVRAKKYSVQLRIWEIEEFQDTLKQAGFDLLRKEEATGGRGHVFILQKF